MWKISLPQSPIPGPYFPWQCLYFRPLPQGQGSLRPTLGWPRTTVAPSGLLAEPIGEPERGPPAPAAEPKEAMLLWLADCEVIVRPGLLAPP